MYIIIKSYKIIINENVKIDNGKRKNVNFLIFDIIEIYQIYGNIYIVGDIGQVGGIDLGVKLAEIEEGGNITLLISNKDGKMKMDAVIKKQVKDNIALIEVHYSDSKRLVFENVQIDVEYYQDEDVPIIWHNAKILSYKTDYVLQVASDGVRHNRRNCFRVAVATTALFRMAGRGSKNVMIRDISLSGFAITDRKMELNLAIGDLVSVFFEDLGHTLDLDGRVVRIEEREDMIIYGLELCNMCKDLSSYVSLKQRRNRQKDH